MTQSSRGRDCEQGKDDDFKYYNFWLLGLGVSFIRIAPARAKRPETFGLVWSLILIGFWVYSKFGVVRLHRFWVLTDRSARSPIKAGLFKVPLRPDYSKSTQGQKLFGLFEIWICSNFGFVRNLDLFELWVCSNFGFVWSLGLFEVWVCSKFGFIRLHQFGVLADTGARSAPRFACYVYRNLYSISEGRKRQ